ncbi:PEP-CTERM sorting domain-containing protein [Massilia violaceinigra]|uniref:PEP-CTERM sorting domain-containing protein n=1 Tax=Massilia violaceinigra TaxID=2045208 RepID=A0ABY4ADJ9_9BURK|nr:NF038120 family PEP-CTERM protein [Massilia violaceinigra]UOD32875.1 PEP-CTERM sorting domain-containing protein [Massilia violaceinigra]
MNRTVTPLGTPRRATRALHTIAAVAALFCALPAMASPITFESSTPNALLSGESISEGGYQMLILPSPDTDGPDLSTAFGAVVNSNDPNTCTVFGCPTGASGHFLAVLNDGGVKFTRDGQQFQLGSLSLAFLPPADVADGDYGLLQFSGIRGDGTVVSSTSAFPGQAANGSFSFGSALIDQKFRNEVLTSLTINACLFDGNGGCFNSLENPAFHQAQFALDNISFNAVPEPGSFLLMGLGIGALGLTRRRSKASASTPATI